MQLSSPAKTRNPLKILNNFFFPPQCVFCDILLEPDSDECICKDCFKKISESPKRLCCTKCGKPVVSYGKRKICHHCYDNKTKYFNRIVSAFEYDGLVKSSILRFKSRGIPSYAPTYAKLLTETVSKHYGNLDFDFICSAPSHTDKKWDQGFDNVELICKHLSKELNIPFRNDILRKVRQTPRQTGLDYYQRRENLKDSMKADKNAVTGKTLLLVDDVCTTRATIIECSRALKHAGAKAVYAVTIATTVRKVKKPGNKF